MKPEQQNKVRWLTGDEIRAIVKETKNQCGPSDSASPAMYVAAGYKAALSAQSATTLTDEQLDQWVRDTLEEDPSYEVEPGEYLLTIEDLRKLLAAQPSNSDLARSLVKMHEARADFDTLIELLGFDPKRCRKDDGSIDWSLLKDGLKTRDALLSDTALAKGAVAERVTGGVQFKPEDEKSFNYARTSLGFSCKRVDNAGDTPSFTLYHTCFYNKHYQMYRNEAEAMFVALAEALGVPLQAAPQAVTGAQMIGEDLPAPPFEWRLRWYGSPPMKGWSLMADRRTDIAYFGDSVEEGKLQAIVKRHNEEITRLRMDLEFAPQVGSQPPNTAGEPDGQKGFSGQGAHQQPVGEVALDKSVHGWHMKALIPWDKIGVGAKLYAAPIAEDSKDAQLGKAMRRHIRNYGNDVDDHTRDLFSLRFTFVKEAASEAEFIDAAIREANQ
jgi:hypothetical protein